MQINQALNYNPYDLDGKKLRIYIESFLNDFLINSIINHSSISLINLTILIDLINQIILNLKPNQ